MVRSGGLTSAPQMGGSDLPARLWGGAEPRSAPPPPHPHYFYGAEGLSGGHWEVNPNTSAVWNASSMEGRDVLLYWFVPNVGK